MRQRLRRSPEPLHGPPILAALLLGTAPALGVAAPSASGPCYEPGAVLSGGEAYSVWGSTDRFEIYTAPSSTAPTEALSQLALDLEAVLDLETAALGFRGPPGIEDHRLLVAVLPLTGGARGFTDLGDCGSEALPYLVFDDSSLGQGADSQALAAHEVFHAIQVGYGLEELWQSETSPNRWWVEASATYTAQVVVPEAAETQRDRAERWAVSPWRSLETADSSGMQYGSYLFLTSLDQDTGGPDWHHALWESIDGEVDYSLPDKLDSLLAASGMSLVEAHARFLQRASVMDFDFQSGLPQPRTLFADSGGSEGLTAVHATDALPQDQVITAGERGAPEYLGGAYLWFEPGGEPAPAGLAVSLQSESDDRSLWSMGAIAVDGDGVSEVLPLAFEEAVPEVAAEITGLGREWEALVVYATPHFAPESGEPLIQYTSWTTAGAETPGLGTPTSGPGCAGSCGLAEAAERKNRGTWLGAMFFLLLWARRRTTGRPRLYCEAI